MSTTDRRVDTNVEAFVAGHRTLAELEGVSKQEQLRIAEVAHRLLEGGNVEAAHRLFVGLHALDPFDAYFCTALGGIAQREGKLEEADRFYGRALDVNPFALTAWANRAEVRVGQGRIEEAMADFARVADLDPDCVDPVSARARAVVEMLVESVSTDGGTASV